MFGWIVNKIAGDYNQRQINKILPLLDKINEYFNSYDVLTDEQIKNKTQEFKDRISAGETLDDILPEAFGLVKQACKRLVGREFDVRGQKQVWDMIPYDVQLIGGIVLHQGRIAEMKTGEGKTLVATLPVYLNALSGKGVHVVTVNDYLASRDAEWMANLYEFMGLTCGYVIKSTPINTRREEYSKDITYVENSELGFDYLRDNLTKSVDARNLIRRPLNYAIVDEVDSILIDEARTPLIISQPSGEATEKYSYYANIVKMLIPSKGKKKVSKGFLKELLEDKVEMEDDGGDYYIDEKTKTVSLSSAGIAKLEQVIGVENIYKDLGYDEIHHIENALRANAVYIKDKDYIIRDNEVLIVDENTGRVMPGRRYSEGLHQAIEAKEGVIIQQESQTLATITYQHFFKLYTKLAGMTGTASTEGEEFEKIYNLEVMAIPTNADVIRVDKDDKVYFSQNAKYNAISQEIKFYHGAGLPILIGTPSIQASEIVSELLRKMNINHYVLNAKYHEQEANIIANAGKMGNVVVATNMAGRGTDIKLEKGLLEKVAQGYMDWIENALNGNKYNKIDPAGVSAVLYSTKEYELTMDAIQDKFQLKEDEIILAEKGEFKNDNISIKVKFNQSKKIKEQAFAEIIIKPANMDVSMIQKDFHYGLYILGTEKHESRRIDNQLRGRAGRQGDPGMSSFFVALDDEIMRKMGGEKIQSLASMILPKSELDTLELTQKQFTSSIIRAQKQMEGWHFGIRKHLFDYDSVINLQRQKIYQTRDSILFDVESGKFDVLAEIKSFIVDIVEKYLEVNTVLKPWNIDGLLESLNQVCGPMFAAEEFEEINRESELKEYIINKISEIFDNKSKDIENNVLQNTLKNIYLEIIDKYWIRNIDDLHYLRERVSMYSYAQQDPLIIYKKEAYEKFKTLLFDIKQETLSAYMKMDFSFITGANIINLISEQDNIVDLIKNASQNVKVNNIQPRNNAQVINYGSDKAKIFEKNDDIEVIEIIEDNASNSVMPGNKVRPNDPCPCGSGKKYKKCCGSKI